MSLNLEDYKDKLYSKGDKKTSNTISFLENNIDDLETLQLYEVRAGDRLDLISADMYKNSSYWWIIAYVNHIEDPIFDLKPGKSILIPDISSL